MPMCGTLPWRKSSLPSNDKPPGFAHFVSLRQPPCRGQRLRPGKAGSAAFAGRNRGDPQVSK
ncbi:hypothetical protein D3H34_03470 [Acidovorax cavernicola]|uniref:Uncharacterized protein n=1 Tax=Acidovorax cavernicola TaxID=1675792 RepID=A0A9X8D8Q2_9BURK|nr:hypothetical protein D3H34_03470 [Acidovorax cavernicola]